MQICHGENSLSSDVLNPDIMPLSIAEESLIESLGNTTTKIAQLAEILREILDDMISDRLEGAKNRFQKAVALFNSCKDSIESSYVYLAKVSTTFSYTAHYMNLLNNIRNLLQDVYKVLILVNASLRRMRENEAFLIQAQKLVDMVISYLKAVTNYFSALASKSSKVDETIDSVSKAVNSIESYVYEILANGVYDDMHSYVLSDNLVDLVGSASKLYEALLCLHIAKKG